MCLNAVRLLEEELLGPGEVEQGLRFILNELAYVHERGDPRRCAKTQMYWMAYSTTLSKQPDLVTAVKVPVPNLLL